MWSGEWWQSRLSNKALCGCSSEESNGVVSIGSSIFCQKLVGTAKGRDYSSPRAAAQKVEVPEQKKRTQTTAQTHRDQAGT